MGVAPDDGAEPAGGARDEPARGGGEPPRDQHVIPRSRMIAAGVFVGALYAAGSIARGDVAPGIVGGILAAILLYLVLQRVSERERERHRR